ncbi:MAG: RNA polymerase sigma factor [Chitinophagaceae bacterium]
MNIKAETKEIRRHTNSWNQDACVLGCVQNKIQYQQELYTRFYSSMMAAVLRYTNDRDEASTILNNGFLRVFKKINTFKNEGSLEGWIRRIIIHSVSDYFRYKNPPIEILKDTIPDNTSSINIESQHDYNLLLNVLNALPQTTRLVINFFIIDGFSHKEIAQMLGISENTSKWHVANGRKILQEKLVSYNNND